jgi:hypothetical protein
MRDRVTDFSSLAEAADFDESPFAYLARCARVPSHIT